MLAAAWAARSPAARERFLTPWRDRTASPVWYRSADGWEAPLWRRPARSGAHGTPVIVSVGLGLDARSVDMLPECSLVNALYEAGFDTFLLSHRGDRCAIAPAGARSFDFDDIVAQDVPAAIATALACVEARRVLWIGHGMGGLLLYSHLARNGGHDLAGGVTLCAPVHFPTVTTAARKLERVARWLPTRWQIPHRSIQRWLLSSGRAPTLATLSERMDGPALRRLALDGTSDLSAGLVRQIGRWHEAGHLCDRDDRFDDLAALDGKRFPLLAIAAPDDPVCPLDAARPVVTALSGAEWHPLANGWGHLDPILGADAPRVVFPRITRWLMRARQGCWNRDM